MSLLAFFGLLLLSVAWVVLPLLPALREFFRPTDVDPLTMVGRDNADISRFARHFREYAQRHLAELPADVPAGDYLGRLADGTRFARVATTELQGPGALPDGSHDRLVVLERAVTLQGGETFRLEIWARQRFTGGRGATYRAILGEAEVHLGANSVVLRWLHGVGTVVVEEGSHLYGRTSSDSVVRLRSRVGFDRIGAPVIAVGEGEPRPCPERAPGLAPFQPDASARRLGDHLRVEDDCVVPPGHVHEGHLVVAGDLRIGAGARINGSVKAHGQVLVEPGACITGSLVSRGALEVLANAWIRGPILSEEHLRLGPGTVVGAPTQQTTVAARTVALAPGVVISGQVISEDAAATE